MGTFVQVIVMLAMIASFSAGRKVEREGGWQTLDWLLVSSLFCFSMLIRSLIR